MSVDGPSGSAEARNGATGMLRGAGSVVSSQRVRPIVILAGTLWFIFAGFRAGLLIASHESLAGVSALNLLWCFVLGLRFDAVPTAVMVVPLGMILAFAPERAFEAKWFRRVISFYAALSVTFALLIEIIGVPFFLYYSSRINWIAMDYIFTPHEALAYIWSAYPVILCTVPPIIGFFGVLWLANRVFWRKQRAVARGRVRYIAAGVLGCAAFLTVYGTSYAHPLDPSRAYFTDNRTLSELTLNNLYTAGNALLSAREGILLDERRYNLPHLEAARETVADMLKMGEAPTEATAHLSDYNVVVIMMESMQARAMGVMGAKPSHTPVLDGIAAKGLLLDNLYAVGDRTCRGIAGVLCSHPDLTSQPLIKRTHSLAHMFTLPEYFRGRGYLTMMICGCNLDFDNMHTFLAHGGIERFYGEESLTGDLRTPWGYHDEVTFAKANEALSSVGEQRFFAYILTVSNHDPFTVPQRTDFLPETTPENREINACRYADWALGQFFEEASKKPWFKRTVFVLVSDHGRKVDLTRVTDVPGYHIPCIFYAPGAIKPGRISTVAGQVDVAPTLLGLMNLPACRAFLGRDVRKVAAADGFAFLHESELMGIVSGENALIVFPDRTPVLYHTDGKSMTLQPESGCNGQVMETLRQRLLSYYRIADEYYFEGTRKLAQ